LKTLLLRCFSHFQRNYIGKLFCYSISVRYV
jgi:hypothetical protein